MEKEVNSIRRYAANHTAKECAKKFGITLNSFYAIARKNDIKYATHGRGKCSYPVELRDKILAYMPKHTVDDTAVHFGIEKSVVRGLSKYYHVKCLRKPSSTLKRDKKIVSMTSGMSYSEVGRRFGITRQRVEQIVRASK